MASFSALRSVHTKDFDDFTIEKAMWVDPQPHAPALLGLPRDLTLIIDTLLNRSGSAYDTRVYTLMPYVLSLFHLSFFPKAKLL